MPKRKSEIHDVDRKRVRRDTQQDISKMFKKRKPVRPVPERVSFSDEWFKSLSSGKDEIGPSGVERLCIQLDLPPDSLEILIFAWRLGTKRMGYFTKEEWNTGNNHFKFESPKKLSQELIHFCQTLHLESQNSKMIHRYGFEFCREGTNKILDKDTAVVMLNCLFNKRWKLFDIFVEYFTNSQYRGMNKDQWDNVYEFARTFGDFEDTTLYDPYGAWPVMIDDYVQFINSKRSEK